MTRFSAAVRRQLESALALIAALPDHSTDGDSSLAPGQTALVAKSATARQGLRIAKRCSLLHVDETDDKDFSIMSAPMSSAELRAKADSGDGSQIYKDVLSDLEASLRRGPLTSFKHGDAVADLRQDEE